MTYQVLEMCLSTTVQTYDATTGKRIYDVPFHGDTHQSGTANLDTNVFICFACGVQGNSLQIIAQQEGISVRDAKDFAERIVGTSNGEVRGKHLSGRGLPKKQGHSNRDSTAGAIRRSRRG
jgi:hypothetical protein